MFILHSLSLGLHITSIYTRGVIRSILSTSHYRDNLLHFLGKWLVTVIWTTDAGMGMWVNGV